MNRIALGTVQFGLAYGVANESGQVSLDEARTILGTARAEGIDTLDTAVGYGESERRLGEAGVQGWRVVTKLPEMPAAVDQPRAWVEKVVGESLDRLRVDRLAGLLLHRPMQLLEARGEGLYAGLAAVREQGVVERIGISIYEPSELDALWHRFPVQMVQAPFSVVDQRIRTSGWLGRLKSAGVEIHTRSAFLQGLLLMQRDRRPAYFARWAPLWNEWDAWQEVTNQQPIETALRFVLDVPEVDRIVVGVDRAAQLREIIEVSHKTGARVPQGLASDDADLVNPARWRVA